MSAFSVDTGKQTMPPLVNGMVHNRLVQFAPHGDQTHAQLIDVLDSAVVHYTCCCIADQIEYSTGLWLGELGGHMSGEISQECCAATGRSKFRRKQTMAHLLRH